MTPNNSKANNDLSSSYIQRHLHEELGVDLLQASGAEAKAFAEVLETLANFVLEEAAEETEGILRASIDIDDDSAGELQGGNKSASIYRFNIPQEEEPSPTIAYERIMEAFQKAHPKVAKTWSVERLRDYMLAMCNHPLRQSGDSEDEPYFYERLGNLMFIASFGPVGGQVRHIDHMDPNSQVCLYMSPSCPSTIVYELEGPPIKSVEDLLQFWEDHKIGKFGSITLPSTLKKLLLDWKDHSLERGSASSYIVPSVAKVWKTINQQLRIFPASTQTGRV